jgi:hypothetical protein
MKHYTKHVMSIMFLSILLIFSTHSKLQAQDVTVSYQSFYDNLSPYGQWVNDPQYGNVFVPNEGGDFRPYGTSGHWVMTDYGNTWVSDDPWGWACYHYGRWTYNPYYGWVWIPGYEWAPAWVSWRYGGGNCGWAPLGPGVELGASYDCPDSWWIFVGAQYMYRPDYFHYWRGPSYNGGYIHQTTFMNNYYRDNGTHVRYNFGPRGDQIQAITHQPVQVYHVSQSNRPGASSVGKNSVSMYRPAVNRATASTARPANVIQAPKAIGRPQAATNSSANHAPAFKQQLQKPGGNNNNNNGGGRPTGAPNGTHGQNNNMGNNQPANNHTNNRPQPAAHNNPASQQRPQPMQQQRPQPQNRPQPAPQQRPQPMQQQRPQPMPQQHAQPMPQQRPQPAPHEEAPHEEAPRGGGERR